MAIVQCCAGLLAEMRSSRDVFDLNNHKSGVNGHLRFCQFPKKVGSVMYWVRIIH